MPTEGASYISELDSTNPGSDAPAGEGDDHLRMLKDVLLASFPALDGLITNTNATGDPGDTDPPDAATFSRLFDDVATASAAAIPIGGIIMWGGTEAQIPEGWQLCNGLNGTPDLRDKFVLGSDDSNSVYTTNQSGGNVWDTTSLAFPTLKTSDSPDATVTVNADTGSSNVQLTSRQHGHWYVPPFYALAYIQYKGV